MADKILVVEDDISLQEVLVYNLEKNGYETECVGDGLAAINTARKICPNLILLDIMLPELDGFEVCRTLRQETNIPIIFLTARDGEIDRVLGFEIGGDDYITKPFSVRELLARIKVRLQVAHMIPAKAPNRNNLPSSQSKGQELFIFGNLAIDLLRHEIRLNGELVQLKPKVYNLLVYFINNRLRVLPRETILDDVWGWDFTGTSRTVDVHVSWLREKIEADPAAPKFILTVRGYGYQFVG
ncbi:MAG: response regulator transcription factor [Anaerolineaceae bacterium]|nr:response regulator transcription factor [Anaerolineaceae bacterium]